MIPELNKIHLMDCMEGMAQMPDNFMELAIVDPEYGIGEDGGKSESRCKATGVKPSLFIKKGWDSKPPKARYFEELFRVSRNQIIWGANHFGNMPPSSSWIVWDKDNGKNDFADCELAFTSFKTAVRKFRYKWHGMIQEKMGIQKETRVHPTQKPEALMLWLLDNYAKKGDKILDTHSGSGSVARACVKRGFDFCAFEIDEDYHRDSLRLLSQARAGIQPRTADEVLKGGGQISILDDLGK